MLEILNEFDRICNMEIVRPAFWTYDFSFVLMKNHL